MSLLSLFAISICFVECFLRDTGFSLLLDGCFIDLGRSLESLVQACVRQKEDAREAVSFKHDEHHVVLTLFGSCRIRLTRLEVREQSCFSRDLWPLV